MKAIAAALMSVLLCAPPLQAAGLTTPSLSPPISTLSYFDADRLVTTGGMKYATGSDLTLEPEWGLGYRFSERGFSGVEESVHRIHAQAGWRLSIAENWYLSAAAKLSVLTIENAENLAGQDLGTRHGLDFMRSFRTLPTWTSEVGIHLGSRTDLMLYYDQSPLSGWVSGGPQQEERLGTRLIFKFK